MQRCRCCDNNYQSTEVEVAESGRCCDDDAAAAAAML